MKYCINDHLAQFFKPMIAIVAGNEMNMYQYLSIYRYFIGYNDPKLFFGEQKKLLDWKIGESLILMDR